jgi:hypothetical protein
MALENLRKTGIKYLLTRLKDYFVQIKDSVRSVNQVLPDANGDIVINRVDFAGDLESSSSRTSIGTYIQRTTGGTASIKDEGDAWLSSVLGTSVHENYVAEVIDLNVYPVDPDSETAITATVNAATFRAAASDSGTYTFLFTTAWDTDPATYGITVSGTPAAGDQIVVDYTAEELGTIVTGQPGSFVSTGWNLYNHTEGYAKVVKYSDEYGFGIDGAYTALQFSETLTGTKSAITVSSGTFSVPSDGYVWVTGGNNSTTAIWNQWSDWTSGYMWENNAQGEWSGYSETTIDLSSLFGEDTPFPYGLCQIGTSRDEINLSIGQAIRRIDRMDNTAENLAIAQASGRDYEVDENYIYIVLASPISTAINIDGAYTANDHGLEYFTGTAVELTAYSLYGENLKNKLERDVVTISQQDLESTDQAQVRANIGAVSAADLAAVTSNSTLTFTKNLNLYDSGNIYAYRNNNIVTITLVNVKVSSTGTNMELASGFPLPACEAQTGWFMGIPWSGDQTSRYNGYVNASGKLCVNVKSTTYGMNATSVYTCAST